MKAICRCRRGSARSGFGGRRIGRALGWLMLSSWPAVPAAAAVVEARWIGGSGVWSDPLNWDIGRAPNNGGGDTFLVTIENPDSDLTITVNQNVALSGLTSSERIGVGAGSTFTLGGAIQNAGAIEAAGGTVRLSGATVENAGSVLRADGGLVELVNTTVNGGTLEVTDDVRSFVQFSGDISLNGVPWVDPGAGLFRVNGTTARFLGDYAHQLPAGYTLQILAWGAHATLNLPGGEYQNEGTIDLTVGYGGWARLHFDQSVNLTGGGRIGMHGNEAVLEGGAEADLTVGAAQSIQGFGKVTLPVLNQGTIEAAGGALVLSHLLENAGTVRSVAGGTLQLTQGLSNQGTVEVLGTTVLTGLIEAHGDLVAGPGGTLRFSGATVENAGAVLRAEGGLVELVNTTVNGGRLEVTDDVKSFVQFSGDISLNGVPWVDPGAGLFRINGTATRFLADYAHQLPAGYTLQILAWGQHASLTLPGGEFQNEGTIDLVAAYGGWARLHFDQSVNLTGAGVIGMHSNETAVEGAAEAVLTSGAAQTIRGFGKVTLPVVNQGTIEAAGGALVFSQLLDNRGAIRSVAGGTLQLTQGLVNSGTVEVLGTTTLSGLIEAHGDLVAGPGGTLRFSNATVENAGAVLRADGGLVELVNTTVNGGTLEVTDDVKSLVQFSGDITLNGVPWVDPGAGLFRINGTATRFLADYAHQLPAGYTLQILAWGQHASLTLPGGEFQNEGTIDLVAAYGGWARLHFDQSVNLTGAGVIGMHSNETAVEGAAEAVLTSGAAQTIRGFGKVTLPVVNQGTIEAAGGALVFSQLLDNRGAIRSVAGGTLQLTQGLVNSGTVEVLGTTTLSGLIEAHGDLVAGPGGTLRFSGATVENAGSDPQSPRRLLDFNPCGGAVRGVQGTGLAGYAIRAAGGLVEIIHSTIHGGFLEATDDPKSLVQFAGDVTMNGVPWVDPGAGLFRVNGTAARFLGDYMNGLPACYRLEVLAWGQHATLNLPGGEYQNEGTIDLVAGYGAWARLHFDQSVVLTGAGQIGMHGNETALEGDAGMTLLVGPEQTVRGFGRVSLPTANDGLLEGAGGTLRMEMPVENQGTVRSLAGGGVYLTQGIINHDQVEVLGTTTVSGPATSDSGWRAAGGGTLRFSGATVRNPGRSIMAEGGLVELVNTTVNGGRLEVTDDVKSFVQFSGDISLNGVPWVDPGAGLFRVNGTTARFLGDYAHQLPAGYFLQILAWGQHATLNLPGGEYQNEGTIDLTAGYGAWARLHFDESVKLAGGGRIGMHGNETALEGGAEAGLTVDADQTLEGFGKVNLPVVNDGRVEAAGGNLVFAHRLLNRGSIQAAPATSLVLNDGLTQAGQLVAGGGGFDVNGSLIVDAAGSLATPQAAPVYLSGHLLVPASGPAQSLGGTVVFDGAGKPQPDLEEAQLLEAVARDEGASRQGFEGGSAFASLVLTPTTRVRLADSVDNAPGAEREAVYVRSLVVLAGATLDLNGLALYSQTAQIAGNVINGSIEQVPDSGPIDPGRTVLGGIGIPGELDEWAFLGQRGQRVAVVLNPGAGAPDPAPAPMLNWASLSVLGPEGQEVARAASSGPGALVVLTDLALATPGIYRLQVRAAPGHEAATGNYSLSLWNSTPAIASLIPGQAVVGRLGSPYGVDRWTFSAAAGQQIRLGRNVHSGSDTVFDLIGPDGWQGFTGLGADSGLITLPLFGTYTVVARPKDGRHGQSYGFTVRETTQVDLPLGVAQQDVLWGSDYARLFRVEITRSGPLRVGLDPGLGPIAPLQVGLDADIRGGRIVNPEIYVKQGSPPTLTDYDLRAEPADSVWPEMLVPRATVGTWYVLVYAPYVSDPHAYSIRADAGPILLTSVLPDTHAADAEATLTIEGAGFDANTAVYLVGSSGLGHPPQHVTVDSFTRLRATFAAGTLTAGTYALRATGAGGASAELPDAVTMLPGGESRLTTHLVLPANVGYHQLATIFVEFANEGDLAMRAPMIQLEPVQNGRAGALLSLDEHRLAQGFWTTAVPEGFAHQVQFLASGKSPGWLQPGERGRVPVYWTGWQQPWDFAYPPVEFRLRVVSADSEDPLDWGQARDSMRPEYIPPAAWEVVYPHFVRQAGDTWGQYLTLLDQSAEYLGRFDERVLDINQLLAFAIARADNGLLPLIELTRVTDARVRAPGLGIEFRRFWQPRISDRFRSGPLGFGWQHNWEISRELRADGTVILRWPGGGRRVFQPDARGGWIAQLGDHATLTGSATALVLRESSGLRYAFDGNGRLASVEELNGNRITCGYSGARLVRLTHSAGPDLQLTYNGTGRIAAVVDAYGRTTRFGYDAANAHLISVEAADGRVVAYSYDTASGSAAEHALTEIVHEDGVSQHFGWDAEGRLAEVFYGDHQTPLSFRYGDAGTVVVSDGLGAESEYRFDHRAQPRFYRDALGNSRTLTYDRALNLRQFTLPDGGVFRMDYADTGHLIRWADPAGNTTRYRYAGPYNRVVSLTDPRGERLRFEHDERGNPTVFLVPDGTASRYAYNTDGTVASWTNRRGQTIEYAYDPVGRLVGKELDGASIGQFACDDHGNLTLSSNAVAEIRYSYDARDRLVRIEDSNGRFLAYEYDDHGRRRAWSDQTGFRLEYGYDELGRVQALRASPDGESVEEVALYAFDAAGRLSRKVLGNGVVSAYEYNAAGQLIHLMHRLPDEALLGRFDYAYDARGLRTSLETPDGEWSYEHDDAGQLVRAAFSSLDPDLPDLDLVYRYDAGGNRLQTMRNGETVDYQVNALNQYLRVGSTRYEFDSDGNLVREESPDGTVEYAWDADNRLMAMESPDGRVEHAYDALGQRVSVVGPTGGGAWLTDPDRYPTAVAGFDTDTGEARHVVTFPFARSNPGAAPSLLRRTFGAAAGYAAGPFGSPPSVGLGGRAGDSVARVFPTAEPALGVEATSGSEGWSYLLGDVMGNVTTQVGSAGEILRADAYQPFGNPISPAPEPVGQSFGFAGQWGLHQEGGGLVNMRARFYAPDLGRFLSEDPAGLIAGPNRYAYVDNRPLSLIDPSGLAAPPPISGAGPGPLFAGKPAGYWVTTDGDGNIIASGIAPVGQGPDNPPSPSGPAPIASDPGPGAPAGGGPSGAGIGGGLATGGEFAGAVGPQDPNQKLSSGGVGERGFIAPGATVGYRIDFENDASAGSPAQFVTVQDQLDATLDWSTVELTELGWGDRLLVIPPGRQHFEAVQSFQQDDQELEVRVNVDFNRETGLLTARFQTINPVTGLPPAVQHGFLPPEDGTGRGQGHASYLVRARSDLPTGILIPNVAVIQFDLGEVIGTNQIDPHDPSKGLDPTKEFLNAIDAGQPASQVLTLPPTTTSPVFPVQWGGADDPGGAGIATYEVYVSADEGAWQLWQAPTGETQADFPGALGHTYAFFSVATDLLGHREAAPPVADAQITVVASLPTRLEILQVGGVPALQWLMVAGQRYTLETTTDLGAGWTSVPDATELPGTGEVFEVLLDAAEGTRFYRLRVGP